MATKKDLVEAHAFSRRRLVTAFVSGAPGGREVEPVRPGRVLIGVETRLIDAATRLAPGLTQAAVARLRARIPFL